MTTEKGSIRVSTLNGGIWVSTRKVGSGRVPKKGPSEYRKGGIRASTEKVRSGRVPEMWDSGEYWKGGIWASTREGSG